MHFRRTLMVGLALLIPLAGCRRTPKSESQNPSFGAGVPAIQASPEVPATPAPAGAPLQGGFAPLVDRVSAAVVNIASTRTVHAPGGPGGMEEPPFFNDPLFREFF